MHRIAKFEKVSYEQFKKDWLDTFAQRYYDLDAEYVDKTIRKIYDSIKLPKRATTGSAGYDFFSPYPFTINIAEVVKIPTGIRCSMENGWVLNVYPRSGHGFKYGISMANTVGVIDQDYYGSDNEGHIFIKLVNDSVLAKTFDIKSGEAFCQGIFTPYGITVDDEATEIRNGGFGSTSKKS